jgi:membrane-bound ClpP family serine protease
MTFTRRAQIAVALMSLGLVAFVVEGVDKGWTALSVVGVACLAVAIAAELVVIRQHQAS